MENFTISISGQTRCKKKNIHFNYLIRNLSQRELTFFYSCTGHSHLPITDDGENLEISSLRGLLIVLGLSVHELFEGLAIGLESSAPDVWFVKLLKFSRPFNLFKRKKKKILSTIRIDSLTDSVYTYFSIREENCSYQI